MRRNFLSRRSGFSLIEVTVALALLAMLLMALFGMQAGSQKSSIDAHEQLIAANAAYNQMESLLMLPDNQFCSYYDSFLASSPGPQPNSTPVPNANYNQPFDVDGYPVNNGYGHFVVREPNQYEAPGYNQGHGPKQYAYLTGGPLAPLGVPTSSSHGSWTPVLSPVANPTYVPAAIAPPLNVNMSLFLVVVWVRIPHSAANSGFGGAAANGQAFTANETFVQLQAWRNIVQ